MSESRRCYHCGEADFELHQFSDLGSRKGVLCPACGEYAYGSNALMAVGTGPQGRSFDLEALVEELAAEEAS